MGHIMRIGIGFFVSIFLGAAVIWFFLDFMPSKNEPKKATRRLIWIMGMVERGMYTAALLCGFPQWIAVWLAFKVAVHWKTIEGKDSARENLYLIGSSLSVAFGILGAWIAGWKVISK